MSGNNSSVSKWGKYISMIKKKLPKPHTQLSLISMGRELQGEHQLVQGRQLKDRIPTGEEPDSSGWLVTCPCTTFSGGNCRSS